jgi:acylpyruvate hydrolase
MIFTGTPPGVGFGMNPPQYLKPGDVIEVWVEKIGSLTNTVVGS